MELNTVTYAMIKPDAVAAKNVGKIIDIIERNGFDIVRLDKVVFTKELAEAFYEEHKEKPFFQELVDFITSGPVVMMALYKENAVADWRKLIGATDPAKAEPGTIRALYGTTIGNNAVHGSMDDESALKELFLMFSNLFKTESSDEDDDADDDEDEDDSCDTIACCGNGKDCCCKDPEKISFL